MLIIPNFQFPKSFKIGVQIYNIFTHIGKVSHLQNLACLS